MEEILDAVLALLKAAKIQFIKSYLWGDPITYPDFDLPAIAVLPVNEKRDTFTTGRDKNFVSVNVLVIWNARDGYDRTTRESPADRNLVRTAETVMGILRENQTLGGLVAGNEGIDVQYVPGVKQKQLMRIATIACRYRVHKSR